MTSCCFNLSILSILCLALIPITGAPQVLWAALDSKYSVLPKVQSLSKSFLSSFLTWVKATQLAVDCLQALPSLALFLTITYGTFLFLQSCGNHKTNSIGSTSWAITTSLASPLSTKEVTWFNPNFNTTGLGVLTSLPWALFSAVALSLVNLSFFDSGEYLVNNLHKFLDLLLSRVLVNWLIAGGTLNLW